MKKCLKRIFITGAGSGLGKEVAIILARRRHTVYASVHYKNQIDDLLQIAKNENLNLYAFKLDILNSKERNLILKYDIDCFISNAAIGDSGSVADVPIDKIREVFNTNVFANLHMIQLAIKNMIENTSSTRNINIFEHKDIIRDVPLNTETENAKEENIRANKQYRIIILSSLVGRIPMPFLSPYCASKFALEGFGTCLKYEMKLLKKLSGIDIKVSLIEPGAYATGFNKENNNKKYEWMNTNSYFSKYVSWIRPKEIKIWNFLEQKPYTPIVKKYVKAVEDKKPHFRYSAPWWQSLFVQLGRIFGM